MTQDQQSILDYEVLSAQDCFMVDRFPARIRFLHWFNAIVVFFLYYLAIKQVIELREISHLVSEDTRGLHTRIGLFWITSVSALSLLSWWNITIFTRHGIVTEKLFIKQKMFYFATMIILSLMGITGILLVNYQNEDLPFLRSTLLIIHFFLGLIYIPMLIVHLYLAMINKNTRRSLRTMLMSIKVDYVSQMPLKDLTCRLTDSEGVVQVAAEVVDISLRRFRVKLPEGRWQRVTRVEFMDTAYFIHPDMNKDLRIPINYSKSLYKHGYYIIHFEFATSLHESAKILLGRACFFKALFLDQRRSPRYRYQGQLRCKYREEWIDGQANDLSVGGISFTSAKKVPTKTLVDLELKFQSQSFTVKGRILFNNKKGPKSYLHFVRFLNLTKVQHDIIADHLDEILIIQGDSLNFEGVY